MKNKFGDINTLGLCLIFGLLITNKVHAQPAGAEVRDLSDWVALHSSTVEIEGEEVVFRRYRNPETTAMITAWPSAYQTIAQGNWRIENVSYNPDFSWNYGTSSVSWMIRNDLSQPLCGFVDDIANASGSGQSRIRFTLDNNGEDVFINYQFVNDQRGIGADEVLDFVGYETFDANNGPNEFNNIFVGTTYVLDETTDLNNDYTISRAEAIIALNSEIASSGYEVAELYSTVGARVDANIYDTGNLDITDNLTEVYEDEDKIYFRLMKTATGELVEGVYRGLAVVNFNLHTIEVTSDTQISVYPNQ